MAVVPIPAGSYSFSGLVPEVNLTIPVPVGSYAFAGQVPTVVNGPFITIGPASYSYSGLVPTIKGITSTLTVPVGSYAFSGLAPSIIFNIDTNATSPIRTIKISAEDRTLIIPRIG